MAVITMGIHLMVDELFNSAKKLSDKLEFLKEEEEIMEEMNEEKAKTTTQVEPL